MVQQQQEQQYESQLRQQMTQQANHQMGYGAQAYSNSQLQAQANSIISQRQQLQAQ